MRPAKQFYINSVLEKTGGRLIEDFGNPYQLSEAVSFLEALGDHDVISLLRAELQASGEAEHLTKEASSNAAPHFTEQAAEGKVVEESPPLSPEGLEKLESTFGTGGRKRRGLVYGGLTLKQFVESQED